MCAKKINSPLERYRIYLRLEKGLSPRTVEAYMMDVVRFGSYLDDEGKKLEDAELDDFRRFLEKTSKNFLLFSFLAPLKAVPKRRLDDLKKKAINI